MTSILILFFGHWYLSAFAQSFYLHRYAAHKMFKLNRFWEKFFYLFTFLVQGTSFLNPRAYAILHRMHHAYSDTPKDPHSPIQNPSIFKMMWQTALIYIDVLEYKVPVEKRFQGDYPEWKFLDDLSVSWTYRILFGSLYFWAYVYLVPAGEWYLFALLPFHWIMGPVHGAIVNWCGHKYGYRNFNRPDESKNTLPVEFLIMGELFQNNHHARAASPNFAYKWFEIDPTYGVMRVLHSLRIIQIQSFVRAKRLKQLKADTNATVSPKIAAAVSTAFPEIH